MADNLKNRRRITFARKSYFEGEKFVVHNGGYEEYIEENKSMSCDALNLLMPGFSGTMVS